MKRFLAPIGLFIAISLVFTTIPSTTKAQATFTQIAQLGRGSVLVVKFSPDGQTIAVGGSQGMWLYNTDFTDAGFIEAPYVYALDWSPDGQSLAYADYSNVIKIVDIETNEVTLEFREHPTLTEQEVKERSLDYRVRSIEWSPDGSKIVSGWFGETDSDVFMWDAVTGEVIYETCLGGALAWSPDSKFIAASGGRCPDSDIPPDVAVFHLWNIETNYVQTGSSGDFVESMTWNNDGQQFAYITRSGAVDTWEVNWPEPTDYIRVNRDYAEYHIFWQDNLFLVSRDDVIELWNSDTWEVERAFTTAAGSVSDIDWHPNTHLIMTASNSTGRMQIWDDSTGELIASHSLHTGDEYAFEDGLAWTPDDQDILLAYSNQIHAWDIANRQKMFVTSFDGYFDRINQISWSPDDQFFMVTGSANTIWIADGNTFELYNVFSYRSSGYTLSLARWLADSQRIVTINGPLLQIWDRDTAILDNTSNQTPLFAIEVEEVIETLTVNPDGNSILFSDGGGVIKLLDMDNGGSVTPFTSTQDHFYQIVFSPDGQYIALSGYRSPERPYYLTIYDSETGSMLFETAANSSQVVTLAWHPTVPLLAIGGRDVFIRIWDISTQELIATIDNGDSVESLEWSHNGSQLASLGADGTVRVWRYE